MKKLLNKEEQKLLNKILGQYKSKENWKDKGVREKYQKERRTYTNLLIKLIK